MIQPWMLAYATFLCFFTSIVARLSYKHQLKNSTPAKVLSVEDIFEEKDGYAVSLKHLLTVEFVEKGKPQVLTFKYHVRWPIGSIINIICQRDEIQVLTLPPRNSYVKPEPQVSSVFYYLGWFSMIVTLITIFPLLGGWKWPLMQLITLVVACDAIHQCKKIRKKLNQYTDPSLQTEVPGRVKLLMRDRHFTKIKRLTKYYAMIQYNYNDITYTFISKMKKQQFRAGEEIPVICDIASGERIIAKYARKYKKQYVLLTMTAMIFILLSMCAAVIALPIVVV